LNEILYNKLTALTDEEKHILNGEDSNVLHYSTTIPITLNMSEFMEVGNKIASHVNCRFTDTGLHKHNYIEIAYMLSGSTTHMIDGKRELVLKKGEFLLLNQHALHYIKRAELEDVAINILIAPEFFDMTLEMAGINGVLTEFLINGIKTKSDGVSYLHFCVADNIPVQSAVETLLSTLYFDENNTNSKKLALALLLSQLMENTGRIEQKIDDDDNSLVADMLWAIETDYRNANLNNIAKENGISASSASKTIKKITGKSFKEHLVNRRLNKARDLIETTGQSIYDICLLVGYENTSYFYRLFEERFGCSPAEYRKRYKKSDENICSKEGEVL